MKKIFNQVGEFDEAFDIEEQKEPNHITKDKDWSLHYQMMKSEIEEYLDAILAGDKIEVADALADIVYLAIGGFRKHGFTAEQAERILHEVHHSNMSKLGEDGKPIYRQDGKVMKGPNYFKPDIEGCL